MKDTRSNRLYCLLALVGSAALAPAAMAQLEMTWHTIDAGGGKMSGGDNLTLEGTIGQHDAGKMAGGGLELSGGYWGQDDAVACWANCDQSTIAPILNVQDFSCFLNEFAAGHASANCDESTVAPVLNVQDFACFLNKFAAGCS
jgi:hypothetical protein